MKMYGDVELQLRYFLALALPEVNGQLLIPTNRFTFSPGKDPRFPLVRRFSGPLSRSEQSKTAAIIFLPRH
jgi:hypothetical protein